MRTFELCLAHLQWIGGHRKTFDPAISHLRLGDEDGT
jgi:hypothetical protein